MSMGESSDGTRTLSCSDGSTTLASHLVAWCAENVTQTPDTQTRRRRRTTPPSSLLSCQRSHTRRAYAAPFTATSLDTSEIGVHPCLLFSFTPRWREHTCPSLSPCRRGLHQCACSQVRSGRSAATMKGRDGEAPVPRSQTGTTVPGWAGCLARDLRCVSESPSVLKPRFTRGRRMESHLQVQIGERAVVFQFHDVSTVGSSVGMQDASTASRSLSLFLMPIQRSSSPNRRSWLST